jgi:hypothetical protein
MKWRSGLRHSERKNGHPSVVPTISGNPSRRLRRAWWHASRRRKGCDFTDIPVSLADYPPSGGQAGGYFANTRALAAAARGRLIAVPWSDQPLGYGKGRNSRCLICVVVADANRE